MGISQPHEAPQDQRDIRSAFLGMAKHLKARPASNVSPFNEAGGNRQTPGWALVRAARACLDAATEKGGDAPTMTVAEVELYFDTLKTIAVRGYERTTCSAELAIVEFAREASEAQAAVTSFAVDRTLSSAMTARREVLELIPAAERVARIDRQLPDHPLPLGAVR